jgi:hypothetical protein
MWDTNSWYAIMWPRLLSATFAQFVSSSVASRLEWQLGSWQKRDRVELEISSQINMLRLMFRFGQVDHSD